MTGSAAQLSYYLFYGMWPVLLLAEALWPARPPSARPSSARPSPTHSTSPPQGLRWAHNFALFALTFALGRGIALLLGTEALMLASQHGLGLMRQFALPGWIALLSGLLVLDFAGYVFHVASHRVGWLWRIHRVHHNDTEVDLTTHLRHHPFEDWASTLYLAGIALIFGFPPETLLVFQCLSLIIEPLSHSNVRLPKAIEPMIRLAFVTPEMHLVHHSAERAETDSNYTMIFPIWDRLLGTYVKAPQAGPEALTMGLENFREPEYLKLPGALKIPFLNP